MNTKLADPTIWQTPSGMELELAWGKDETTGTLYITRKGNAGESIVRITMTIQQLDELRTFLMDNID